MLGVLLLVWVVAAIVQVLGARAGLLAARRALASGAQQLGQGDADRAVPLFVEAERMSASASGRARSLPLRAAAARPLVGNNFDVLAALATAGEGSRRPAPSSPA